MEKLSMLSRAAAEISGDQRVVLFCILGVSLMLFSSFLNLENMKKRISGDFAAVLVYFACFFLLLFVLPVAYLRVARRDAEFLPASFGLTLGDWRLGLRIFLGSIPLSLLIAYLGSIDPAMKKQYPLSKESERSMGLFVVFEAAYLLLFYVAWEFTFRGVMLFGLLGMLPPGLAGAALAVILQSIVSTVFHIGHPDLEVGGTLFAGVFFGAIAVITGSILTTIAIHAFIGILEDSFVYRAHARSRREVSPRTLPADK
jgi:membrane protease YdiL (CAAX protease family)